MLPLFKSGDIVKIKTEYGDVYGIVLYEDFRLSYKLYEIEYLTNNSSWVKHYGLQGKEEERDLELISRG